MTVKEIAQATGKTERSVQLWIKKLSEKNSLINEKSSASSSMKPEYYKNLRKKTCIVLTMVV